MHQQPSAGDTPGVAAAPVALAGAIVPGVARFIVVLSAHADVFGVGITAIVESILVPPSCVTRDAMLACAGRIFMPAMSAGTTIFLVWEWKLPGS